MKLLSVWLYIGLNLGLLPGLALAPTNKTEINVKAYETGLHMQMWANFSREEKEREWAEAQPCIAYELQTVEKGVQEETRLQPAEEIPVKEGFTAINSDDPANQGSDCEDDGGDNAEVRGSSSASGGIITGYREGVDGVNEQAAGKEMEETAPGAGTGGDLVHDTVEETHERSLEISIQDSQNAPVASEDQSSATPLYQINTPDGPCMMDIQIQEYLYQKLAEAGIPWFMPYAVLIAYGESHFNPGAVNQKNGLDMGLFQFRSTYWGAGDIFNPYTQIDVFVGLMANRALNGKTVSEMISAHNVSDYGAYNQSYVDYIMSEAGNLVQVR